MRRFLIGAAAAVLLLALASVAWIRIAPVDTAGWHVDPVQAPLEARTNAWRVGPVPEAGVDAVSPVFDLPALELAEALDAVVMAEPHTTRIAGTPSDLWVTYEQRTPAMRFPDYVSVRAIELEEGRSSLALYSRSRFGRDDMGVNRARVERWLAGLAPHAE